MSHKHTIILVLGLICFHQASCQYLIRGFIKDQNAISIKSATVIARQTLLPGQNKIAAWALTDDQGYYELAIPAATDSLMLQVNCLGFESISELVRNGGNEKIISRSFLLVPKIVSLKEVVMKARLPSITVGSDTITFRADSFRDSTEEVVEDLLKKIPGVEIGKDGSILMNGKRIERILIDGDDLFNRNYTLLSKNLAAALVDKVQVIDQYTGQPLLKGLVNSDLRIINLTLKTAGKKIFFGNASLAGGNKRRYDLAANLIGFNKKSKLFALGNTNSIGRDPVADPGNDQALRELTGNAVAADRPALIRTENLRPLPTDFEKGRVNFNRARLVSFAFLHKPFTGLQAKGYIFFSGDRNELFRSGTYQYLTNRPPITITELARQRQSPSIADANLNIDFHPHSNQSLQYTFNFRNDRTRSLQSQSLRNLAFTGKELSKSHWQIQELTYLNRINERKLWIIHAIYSRLSAVQDFTIQRDPPPPLPYVHILTGQLVQSISQTTGQGSVTASYIYGNASKNVAIETGLLLKNAGILSNLDTITSPQQNMTLTDSFSNYNLLKQTAFFGKISVSQPLGPQWKFIAGITCSHQHQAFRNLIKNTFRRGQQWVISPELALKWNANNQHLSVGYAYNATPPELPAISEGLIMTNYRTFQTGTNRYHLRSQQLYLVNYNYADWAKQLLFFFNWIAIRDRGLLADQYQFQQNFDIIQILPELSNQNNSLFSAGLDKFIPLLLASAKLKFNFSTDHFEGRINSIANSRISTSQFGLEISLRSAWKIPVNIHAGAALNRAANKSGNPSMFSALRYSVFLQFLDIYFRIGHNWFFQLNADRYYFPNNLQPKKSTLFLDFQGKFSLPASKFQFELEAKNILDNKIFSNYSFTPYSVQSQQYRLLPACFLARITCRF